MIASSRKSFLNAIAAALLAGGIVAFLAPSIAFADSVSYLAIGDSYAWGYQSLPVTPPVEFGGGSDGSNQGYVGTFANFLSSREGSTVNVINTARPGERTTTYTNNTSPTGFNFNTNYASSGYNESQSALVASEITQSTAGSIAPIKYVTVQLGGNDLLDLFPDFTSTPTIGQIGAFQTALVSNLTPLLTSLRASLPDARIFLLDYPNPFNGSTALTPEQKIGFNTIAQTYGNGTLQSIANSVSGVEFVDLYPGFVGQEASLTNINTPDAGNAYNFHPNSAGYGVIANTLSAAVTVPEPGTLALAGLGIAGIAVGIIRRRRTA